METDQVALDDIIATDAFWRRAERPRDVYAENTALRRVMLDTLRAEDALSPLLAAALDVCGAGSAGISILEEQPDGRTLFRWVALAGRFASYVGGTTPADFSPCGTTLARGCTQLFTHPARLYTYFADAQPEIIEGLVIPFLCAGEAGTIWIVSHDPGVRFTSGDAEFMTALAEFTAAAWTLRQSERRETLARAAAEAANRMQDEFLATVCHELRTPLNSIVGWSEVLADAELPGPEAAEAVAAVRDAALRQSALVDDLLDTARIAGAGLPLERAAVGLESVVEKAVDAVRPLAAARRLRLEVTLDAAGAIVVGDSGRLQQALANIITNAVKFTPPSGAVRVAAHQSGDRVLVRVDDTGIGIDADFLPHVFDRFRQEDSSSRRRVGGLGLGLAISQDIIGQHGGTIEAASAGRGRGATFTVTLTTRPASAAGFEAAAPRAIPVVPASRLDDVRILFVDDDPDAREVIAVILTQRGAHVRVAASVGDARQILRSWAPDLLVSDLAMPDEDGYQLIAYIRSGATPHAHLRAAALSACAAETDRERALKAGFDLHLAKPVTASRLVSSLASLVGQTDRSQPRSAAR